MALTPDQMDAVVRRTVALYDDAERLLLDRIAKSLAEGLDAPDWAAKKLLEVQMVQARLRRDLNLLAGKAAALRRSWRARGPASGANVSGRTRRSTG